MAGDEQSVHVVDRKGMKQDVSAREAPLLDQGERVASEIAVREHGALERPVVPDV